MGTPAALSRGGGIDIDPRRLRVASSTPRPASGMLSVRTTFGGFAALGFVRRTRWAPPEGPAQENHSLRPCWDMTLVGRPSGPRWRRDA